MKKLSKFLKTNFGLIIVLLLQIPLILPFFHRGFFPSHDDVQVTRIFEMFQSLKFGDFPPRWSANLLFGYGYPLYIFYGPLPYLIGAFFAFIVPNFLLATKFVFVLSFFIGPIGVYFLTKEWWGKLPALIASAAFSYVPYRPVDVFVRGNLGEFFSFSLFPLVFFFNWKFLTARQTDQKKWGIVFCLFLFFQEISHNISCFIFFFFLLIFNLFYVGFFIKKKEDRFEKVIWLSVILILSLSMAAFYFIPLFYETRFVLVGQFRDSPYQEYFLTLKKLWNSPWGWGGYTDVGNAVSLQLGKVVVIISLFTVLLNNFIKTNHRRLINFFVFCAIFLIFMELSISDFIWSRVTLLHFFQFPWRLHILITLFLSILCGGFFFLFQQKIRKPIILAGVCLVVLSLFIIENVGFFKPRIYWNAPSVSETTTWNDEYLPKWVKVKPKDYAGEKVIFIGEKGTVLDLTWGYLRKEFTVQTTKDAKLKISHVYYPGWEASIDNNKSEIKYNNPGGLMEVSVPKGKHKIAFVFKRTAWRYLADVVSVVGITIFLLLIIKEVFKKDKTAASER